MKIIFQIKNTCKLTALASFAIGTILVILFTLFQTQDSIIIIGIYYISIAAIINIILFFGVLISAFYYRQYRIELFSHCGLLLLNIPIALAYFLLIIKLSGL